MKKVIALAGSLALAVFGSACSSTDATPSGGAAGTTADAGMGDMDGMAPAEGTPSSTAIAPVTVDAVYVVNGGDSSISVVDAVKGTLVGTIKLKNADFPHHIYLSADGAMLAVAIPGMDLSGGHHGGMDGMKGAVMVLDAKTGATMASRRLDAMNHNAVFSPDGSEVWTSAMTMMGKVVILDAMTLQTKGSIDVGDMPAEITFTKDGKLAFVANGMSNDVSVVDVATKKVTKTIAVDKDPVGAWPGADGLMYVDCEESKTLKALDPKTLGVVRTYNLGFTPGMARTTPAGNALWVTNGDDGKVVVDMTTMDMKMGEVATGAGAHGLAFSVDGKTAYVTNQGDGSLSIIDVAGEKVRTKVTVGAKPNGIVFRGH